MSFFPPSTYCFYNIAGSNRYTLGLMSAPKCEDVRHAALLKVEKSTKYSGPVVSVPYCVSVGPNV